jgi:hypothetical protein
MYMIDSVAVVTKGRDWCVFVTLFANARGFCERIEIAAGARRFDPRANTSRRRLGTWHCGERLTSCGERVERRSERQPRPDPEHQIGRLLPDDEAG